MIKKIWSGKCKNGHTNEGSNASFITCECGETVFLCTSKEVFEADIQLADAISRTQPLREAIAG